MEGDHIIEVWNSKLKLTTFNLTWRNHVTTAFTSAMTQLCFQIQLLIVFTQIEDMKRVLALQETCWWWLMNWWFFGPCTRQKRMIKVTSNAHPQTWFFSLNFLCRGWCMAARMGLWICHISRCCARYDMTRESYGASRQTANKHSPVGLRKVKRSPWALKLF